MLASLVGRGCRFPRPLPPLFPRRMLRVDGAPGLRLSSFRLLSTSSDEGGPCKAIVLNAGSSSIKFAVFDVFSPQHAQVLASGIVDRIGSQDSFLRYSVASTGRKVVLTDPVENHEKAVNDVVRMITDAEVGVVPDVQDIAVVGHRIVHGGETMTEARVVNDHVINAIKKASVLAPLHNPHHLKGIEVASKVFKCPHVTVFDTAFHTTMPPAAFLYALPRTAYTDKGIRRHGFHGTSYKFVVEQTARYLNKDVQDTNLVVMHLGNGASVACIKGGKSVDTSMGMTPQAGLVMGTRSGDVDTAVIPRYVHEDNMSLDEVMAMLRSQSGLKGLCGSSDLRDIEQRIAEGDQIADEAFAVYVHRIRHYLGAYLLNLGNAVDAIVFTAGGGEHSADARRDVLKGLEDMGIVLDEAKNMDNGGHVHKIVEMQAKESDVRIMVVPTNEELSIVLQSVVAARVMDDRRELLPSPARTRAVLGDAAATAQQRLCVVPLLGANSTLSEISLMTSLAPEYSSVGYFRPITTLPPDQEPQIQTMKQVFGLSSPPDAMCGVTLEETLRLIAEDREDALIARIVDKFLAYQEGHDFVLVSGCHDDSHPSTHDLNLRIATALRAPMVLVHKHRLFANAPTTHPLSEVVACARDMSRRGYVRVSGVLVDGVRDGRQHIVQASLEKAGLPVVGIFAAPTDSSIGAVAMHDIATALNAEVIRGRQHLLSSRVQRVYVADGTVPHCLSELLAQPPPLFVVNNTRTDMLMSVLFALRSSHPGSLASVCGLLVTGGKELPEVVTSAMQGMGRLNFPVIAVDMSTKDALKCLEHVVAEGVVPRAREVEYARMLAEKNIERSWISSVLSTPAPNNVTPQMLANFITSVARRNPQTIVLPESDDPRIVTAASRLASRGLCKVVLLGDDKQIEAFSHSLGVSLEGVAIINPNGDPALVERMATELHGLRKHKGLSLDDARQLCVTDFNYFGTMLMHFGMADGMVSGACHTTANTVRPPLQIIRATRKGGQVSSTFFMLLPTQVVAFADCAVMTNPTAQQLAELALDTSATARAFGIEPRVAMLSYSTGQSGSGDLVDKVKEATKIAKELAPELPIEGPIQFDAAFNPNIAKLKIKHHSLVAGQATVFVFPDLNAANIAYKAVQQSSNCIALGPLLQGLNKPVNDLSRGCTVEDVVSTVLGTVVQAVSAKTARA